MNMKMVRRILQNHTDYKTADTVNYEGNPAWSRKGLERFREILFLGITGNQFYVDAAKNITNKIEDLEKLIMDKEIPVDKIKELIVSARQEGLFRTIPILALVLLRKRSPQAFSEIFNQVVITGNDLVDFLDMNKEIIGGFGRAVKKALHEYLRNAKQFYALKYRKQLVDAIAISRPAVDQFDNKLLLKYIYAVRKDMTNDELMELFNRYEQVKAAELFKLYVQDGKIDEAINIAKDAQLPADLMIGLVGDRNEKEIWRVILKNMGLMQFIKYLNKLVNVGLKEEVIERLKSITPSDFIKAKIFTYRLFITWLNTKDVDVKMCLENLLNAFGDPEKYQVLSEEWYKYTYAICPDISSSMTLFGSNPSAADIAGFFAAVLAKQLKTEEVLLWADETYPLNVKNESFMHIYKEAHRGGGGTAMSSPILHMIQNYVELPDIVIIITDSETWADKVSVKNAWRQYKKRNPRAKLVVIEVAGYGHSTVDEDFANKYEVYTVFGWSDSVFKWIEMKVI